MMNILKFVLTLFIFYFSIASCFAQQQDEADALTADLFRANGVPYNLTPHPAWPNMYIEKSFDPKTQKSAERILIQTADENGKKSIVPIETATTSEIKTLMQQDADFMRAVGGSIAGFPKEALKFNAALIVMELVSCYGVGNGSLFSNWEWKPTTNSNTPLCAEQLLQSMTTLEGNLGFFSFILANRLFTAQSNNLLTQTFLMINKEKTPQWMAKARPWLGYFGMAFGMAAQQVVSYVLTIPSFKECSKAILQGNIKSPFCAEAVNHFLSAEKFWLDFGAGIPSLVGGAMMSAGSQKFIHFLATNGQFSGKYTTFAAKRALLEGFKNKGIPLKVAKYIIRFGKLGTGIVVIVGEVVIFLAWTKLLEIPTMQMVWSWYDKPDIRRNTQQLLDSSTRIEKAGGFTQENFDFSCHSYKANPRQVVPSQRCNAVDYFTSSIKDLSFYSKRFREKVTLARFSRAYPDYMMKWESYISSFFAAKFLLTDIYSQREKKPSPKLSLYDMAFAVKTTWDQYLNGSTYYMASSHAEFLKKEIPNLAIAFENYKKSFSEPNADVSTVERNVARAILAIKNKVEPQKPYDIEKPCGGYHEDPYYCRAIKILKLIPRTEAELLALPKETLLSYNISLIQTFGEALPVEQTLRDVLCANSTRFVSKAKMDGLPARLEMPRLITGHEKDPYYQESCAFGKINSLFLASDADASEDFLDPQPGAFWLASFPAKTEIAFYIDPLTPLTDVRMNLSSGPTLELATKWWNRQILPEIMEFYKQYISNYKQALNDNFLSFIRYEKPEVLLHLGSPLRGVPLSDKNIYQKVTSRQSVNLSLIGEMQIYAKALEKVSTTLISAKDKATFAQTLQQFLISFAEHTRHYGWVSEPTALDSIPIPVNKEGFPANPDLFARTVAETLFGNTYLQKGERMNGLQVQLDDLSSIVVGLKFFDLTDVYSTLDKTPEQVSKMSQDEYKKYTVLQILHHMNLVIEESNDYYDRYLFLTGLFNLTNNKK